MKTSNFKQETYMVISPVTIDRNYTKGETVTLSNEKLIKKLLILNIIKK